MVILTMMTTMMMMMMMMMMIIIRMMIMRMVRRRSVITIFSQKSLKLCWSSVPKIDDLCTQVIRNRKLDAVGRWNTKKYTVYIYICCIHYIYIWMCLFYYLLLYIIYVSFFYWLIVHLFLSVHLESTLITNHTHLYTYKTYYISICMVPWFSWASTTRSFFGFRICRLELKLSTRRPHRLDIEGSFGSDASGEVVKIRAARVL